MELLYRLKGIPIGVIYYDNELINALKKKYKLTFEFIYYGCKNAPYPDVKLTLPDKHIYLNCLDILGDVPNNKKLSSCYFEHDFYGTQWKINSEGQVFEPYLISYEKKGKKLNV